MTREEMLLQNYKNINLALQSACQVSGRKSEEISLLAVTKYAADEDVLFLLEKSLIHHVGESRVGQAWERWKSPDFAKFPVVKHFIGHLQKNKAAKAAELFDFIDSLDSFATALAIEKHLPAKKIMRTLVQVKLTNRETQSGLSLPEARQLVQQLRTLQRVHVCGYMAIAPQGAQDEELRNLFRQVKNAFEQDFPVGTERYLSLGMSEDFTVAVEEGSSLPRIGSGLFATNLEVL